MKVVKKSSVLFAQPAVANAVPALPALRAANQPQLNNLVNQIVRNASTASTTPAASSQGVSHGSSTHWNVERYLSVALLAIIPASLLLESPVTDYILAISLVFHSHWGIQCVLTDYLHGPTLPKVGNMLLYVVSALTLAGLCYFNYADIGLSKAVKKIWSL